ncbi:MAG: outer membrane protein assembly factor BamB family protein [Planctomycetaceae bacterium]
MSLKGNLSSVNLTEIFQMLSLSGREGTLFIYEGARKRAICFTKEGVSIRSRERNEASLIGKILVRLGKIAEEDLARAIAARDSGSRVLGDVLVEEGVCSREDVELAFRIQSEEDIQDLFLNKSDAQFEYVDGYFPENDGMPFIHLNVNSLLIEIARRSDEWEYIRRRVRSPREIYHFTGVEAAVEADVLAQCSSHRIDPLIDGTNAVGDLIELSYVNRFEVCKLLAGYLDAGIIELVPPDTVRQNARQCLRSGDAAGAIRHYEYLMATGEFPLEVLCEAAEAHEDVRDYTAAAGLLRRFAEELVREGDYRGAVDALRRVATFSQPDPEALRFLIDLVLEQPRAAADFTAQVVEAGKTLVALMVKNEQRGEALQLLEKLVRAFPDEVAFAVSLVNVYYENGNLQRAAQECEKLANGFLKRRRHPPAISLLKKLLIIDPDRNDIREKLRKITSGRRRSPTPVALPRIAVALAATLLVGGAAVVVVKREHAPPVSAGGLEPEILKKFLGAFNAEMALAEQHGTAAASAYDRLLEALGSDPHSARAKIIEMITLAEDRFAKYDERSRKALSIGETIRKQAPDEETALRARAMLASLRELDARVQAARTRWQTEGHAAAVRQHAAGEMDYKAGRLQLALDRLSLARALSPREEWRREADLDRLIANLSNDVEKVRESLRVARAREEEGNWTGARQVYIALLSEYAKYGMGADVVQDLRLPVEILTVPPGATVLLDGEAVPQATPVLIRVTPFAKTTVTVRKKGFREESLVLGPFGAATDPAEYSYSRRLLKAPKWSVNLQGPIESAPAAAQGQVFVASRHGRYMLIDAATQKVVAKGSVKSLDGVSAGIATDGRRFFVPTLDGVVHVFEGGANPQPAASLPAFPAKLYATPAIADGVLYVVDFAGTVWAYDLATGSKLWSRETSYGCRTGVVVHGAHLVVMTSAGHVTVLARGSGEKVVEYDLKGTFVASPAVAGPDDLVFGSEEGTLFGVEKLTGYRRWERSIRTPVRTTPLIRGRLVFLPTQPGELVAVNAQTGDEVDRYGGSGTDARAPVSSSDRVFFAVGQTLAAFAQRSDGSYGLAWTFHAEGRILAGPVSDGAYVYIGDERGNLYCLATSE